MTNNEEIIYPVFLLISYVMLPDSTFLYLFLFGRRWCWDFLHLIRHMYVHKFIFHQEMQEIRTELK